MGFAAKTFYGCEAKKKTNNNSQCSKETSIGDKMGWLADSARLLDLLVYKTVKPWHPVLRFVLKLVPKSKLRHQANKQITRRHYSH